MRHPAVRPHRAGRQGYPCAVCGCFAPPGRLEVLG